MAVAGTAWVSKGRWRGALGRKCVTAGRRAVLFGSALRRPAVECKQCTALLVAKRVRARSTGKVGCPSRRARPSSARVRRRYPLPPGEARTIAPWTRQASIRLKVYVRNWRAYLSSRAEEITRWCNTRQQ